MNKVNEYKCLNCKAPIVFDPPSQKWKCDYCFSEFTKEQLDEVYTDEGIEKKKIEAEKKRKEAKLKKEQEQDVQLEKVLVMLGIIKDESLRCEIEKRINDYEVSESEEADEREDLNESKDSEPDNISEEENETQVFAFIKQAVSGKKQIDLKIIDEEKTLKTLTRNYSSIKDIRKEVIGMSLMEVVYDHGKFEVSRDYFSPMGFVYMLQQGNLKEINFLSTPKSLGTVEEVEEENEKELDVYRCTSCGAELIADDTISATFCVYCKSPAVIKARFQGKFKPKWVIPFRITQENAVDLYTKWIKKKIFAPKAFKNKREIEKISGIYAPFWLFDCNAVGSISGRGTKVHSYRRGDYQYTTTKYYSVARAGNAAYEKIPIDSSQKLDDELMYMAEPYNYKDITEFSMQYMTGFMAEKYDVEVDDAEEIMEKRAKEFLSERLEGTVNHYTTYHTQSKNMNLLGVENNYALLPIYLLVNKYNGKEHKFVINGQTGKVVGQTPISFAEQLKYGVGIFIAILLIAVFGGGFFG